MQGSLESKTKICFSPLVEPRQPQMTRGSFSARQTLPTPQTPYLFSEKGSKFTIERDTKHSIFHLWVPGFFFCATILLDELENNHNLQVDWVVLEHPMPRRLCREPLQNIVKVAIFLVWPSSKVPGVKPVVTVRRGVFVWVEPAVFAAMGGGHSGCCYLTYRIF